MQFIDKMNIYISLKLRLNRQNEKKVIVYF